MAVQTYRYIKHKTGLENSIELERAFTFWRRFWGLMGRKEGEWGLILNRTNQVHLFFMRFPLDLYYLNKEGTVLHIFRSVKPWRVAPRVKGAYYVMELPAGHPCSMEVGDYLEIS